LKHKKLIIILFFLGVCIRAHSQDTIYMQLKTIELSSDTIKIDSLSLVPGSIHLMLEDGSELDTGKYSIDLFNAVVILAPSVRKNHQVLGVSYKRFPFDLTKEVYHKDVNELTKKNAEGNSPLLIYQQGKTKQEDLFGLSDFTKSGSISRAISTGNTQDLSVASNLNLQIAGNITPDLKLTAAITDNNIPIQPDGNTQQIQDFDKVFIMLSHKNGSLTAGDFEIKKPSSYFLNYHKKAQGVYADVRFILSKKKQAATIRTYGGIALSRGKFARNQIIGIEGSQGPYKLHGGNFERYIVVLSGTEKVYIDGKLLKRGQNYDYIIDYNTAEIVFMPGILITKDKRINVEFQYSDRNYASYLLNSGMEYSYKNLYLATHYYKESDLKNQALDQELSDSQQKLLYDIGDSLHLAITPNVDSVAFNGSQVLYKKIDSLGYSPVYVYSTNPDSAYYRLSFSMVGAGNGSYIQIKSAANGRVFKWVAPINGVLQGDYAPIVLLVTPKKKRMLTTIAKYSIFKNTNIKAELALSENDQNLFSTYDKENNKGMAYKLGVDNVLSLSKTTKAWQVRSSFNYEYVDRNFEAIERYRSVEFNRDWNVNSYDRKEQHLFDAGIRLEQKKQGFIAYRFKSYRLAEDYSAFRNQLNANLNLEHQWHIDFKGNITQSNEQSRNTKFVRHRLQLSKGLKWFRIGVGEELEDNRFTNKLNDSLSKQSFAFQEYTAFLENVETSKNKFRLHYKWREDKVQNLNTLSRAMKANELGLSLGLIRNRRNKLKLTFSYRQLEVLDSNLTKVRPDETGLGQIDHSLRLWKGGLIATSFYQLGSVMEVEKEFSYIEVAPGQGVYSWSDYNNNGVKELDEFELAAFADQANYIRVYIPGTNFIKTFGNQFSTSIMLNPSRFWRKSNRKLLKGLSHFANQLVYRSAHKTLSYDVWEIANPFYTNLKDQNILSLNSSFRNTFYFNRTHPKYGADISYRKNKMKILMTNGTEQKELSEWQLKLRWNFRRTWQLNLKLIEGLKTANSEYFHNRDYYIGAYSLEPNLIFQPNKYFRIKLKYAKGEKINLIGQQERLRNNTVALDAKYNMVNKGIVSVNIQYISMNYNGSQNGPVAFEMMDGLRSGDNFTWNISYQRTLLKNLQLSLSYNGRKPAGTNVIHIGSMQLRAYF